MKKLQHFLSSEAQEDLGESRIADDKEFIHHNIGIQSIFSLEVGGIEGKSWEEMHLQSSCLHRRFVEVYQADSTLVQQRPIKAFIHGEGSAYSLGFYSNVDNRLFELTPVLYEKDGEQAIIGIDQHDVSHAHAQKSSLY